MKKFTLLTLTALMTSSVLLNGCGLAKSSQEEYAELCKQYEPYYAFKISGKFYNTIDRTIMYTDKQHSVMDNHKNYILEGEKIFKQMENLASKDKEIMNQFQMTYLFSNNTPTEAKRLFNLNLDIHKRKHSGCTYDFKF